ncbi:MAG: hypothetical protein JW938_04065, partial [Candidatus Omnitrophica bacterium]|nr:hypothetical protein [Candidatus Omnitrophota bacterium]
MRDKKSIEKNENVVIRVLENDDDLRGDKFTIPEETFTFLEHVDTMHIADIVPGTIRGNHYHIDQKESLIVLHKDAWTLGWGAPESDMVKTRNFEGCGAVLVEIGPHVAHAVSNAGSKPLTIIALSNGQRSRDGKETIR